MAEMPGTTESRSLVQQAVERSAAPVSVDDIAARTGLHANTVRGHLDVLIAHGTVTRDAAQASGRGRPRWLYRPAGTKPSPFQSLAEVLSRQLALVEDPALAERAAETWAQVLPDLPVASTPDDAVAGAADALNRLGFDAIVSPIGDAVIVKSCPYVDLIEDNPVICDIHTSLVSRLLKETGQPVTVEAMDVLPRPGICVARLRRPDLTPIRTIVNDDADGLRPPRRAG